MAGSRASRWLVILGAAASACSAAAARPGAVVPAPPPSASTSSSAPPVEPARPAVAAAPPPAEPAPPPVEAEPPPVEPVAVLPPCPADPRRDADQKPGHVLHLLDLAPAMTVVDLGSGSGYFLCHLSRAVGASGHVIATDIDKQLVQKLEDRARREHLANVAVVRAPASDVGIAPGTADRILMVNVWHHLPDRKRYAARVARALASGGKVVIIDFKPRGDHGILPERVLAELTAGGIDGAVVADELTDQYVIVGTRHSA